MSSESEPLLLSKSYMPVSRLIRGALLLILGILPGLLRAGYAVS